jgi:beta-glucosidase-like glycosyl hydrolase
LHSLNGGGCVTDSHNRTRCPTNFPGGPAFGAAFDRPLVQAMARQVGVELRAMFALRVGGNPNSLDCWGPVINLNRDPRCAAQQQGQLQPAARDMVERASLSRIPRLQVGPQR